MDIDLIRAVANGTEADLAKTRSRRIRSRAEAQRMEGTRRTNNGLIRNGPPGLRPESVTVHKQDGLTTAIILRHDGTRMIVRVRAGRRGGWGGSQPFEVSMTELGLSTPVHRH